MLRPLLRTLREQPGEAQLLFEDDDMVFGNQSCIVGAGFEHMKAQRTNHNQHTWDHPLRDGVDQFEVITGELARDGNDGHEYEYNNLDVSYDTDEVPAVMEAEEAERIVDELWASSIERRLSTEAVPLARSHPPPLRMFTFSRHPRCLDDALLNCPLALKLQAKGIDLQPPWANGAKVLAVDVTPELFDIELCPRHVVVSDADESAILEALQSLPCNRKPRLKLGTGNVAVPSTFSLMQDFSVVDRASDLYSLPGSSGSSTGRLCCSCCTGFAIDFEVQDLPVRNTFIEFRSPVSSPRSPQTV